MKIIENLKYAQYPSCLIDLILPDKEPFDVIIWFHGGGLESGSRKGITGGIGRELAEIGFAVASADYRLYPSAKFPDYIKDAARAVRYVIDHSDMYGKVGRFFVGGSSAGAYLTLMLALDRSYFRDAGVDVSKISGYLSDSAQTTVHYNVLRERSIDPSLERIDEAAPLYHLNKNSDFGNMLLVCYDEDIKCRPEQNRLFYAAAMHICPQNRMLFKQLPGRHCSGTSKKNSDGSYDFVDCLKELLS